MLPTLPSFLVILIFACTSSSSTFSTSTTTSPSIKVESSATSSQDILNDKTTEIQKWEKYCKEEIPRDLLITDKRTSKEFSDFILSLNKDEVLEIAELRPDLMKTFLDVDAFPTRRFFWWHLTKDEHSDFMINLLSRLKFISPKLLCKIINEMEDLPYDERLFTFLFENYGDDLRQVSSIVRALKRSRGYRREYLESALDSLNKGSDLELGSVITFELEPRHDGIQILSARVGLNYLRMCSVDNLSFIQNQLFLMKKSDEGSHVLKLVLEHEFEMGRTSIPAGTSLMKKETLKEKASFSSDNALELMISNRPSLRGLGNLIDLAIQENFKDRWQEGGEDVPMGLPTELTLLILSYFLPCREIHFKIADY